MKTKSILGPNHLFGRANRRKQPVVKAIRIHPLLRALLLGGLVCRLTGLLQSALIDDANFSVGLGPFGGLVAVNTHSSSYPNEGRGDLIGDFLYLERGTADWSYTASAALGGSSATSTVEYHPTLSWSENSLNFTVTGGYSTSLQGEGTGNGDASNAVGANSYLFITTERTMHFSLQVDAALSYNRSGDVASIYLSDVGIFPFNSIYSLDLYLNANSYQNPLLSANASAHVAMSGLLQRGAPGSFIDPSRTDATTYVIQTPGVLEGIIANGTFSSRGTFSFALSVTPETEWKKPGGGIWDTAINWDTHAAPSNSDDVLIAPSTSLTVTGPSSNTTVNSLTLGGSSTTGGAPGSPTLALQPGGDLSIVHELSVNAGGTFAANGAKVSANDVSNSGALILSNGKGNTSTIAAAGDFTQTVSGSLGMSIYSPSFLGRYDAVTVAGTASLAGKLSIMLGQTAGVDFVPSNTDTYSVISAKQISGTFAQTEGKLIEAKFGSGSNSSNNNSAGLFSISYRSPNGTISLSNFHQIRVLAVGVTDYENANSGVPADINGAASAFAVQSAFASKVGVVSSEYLPLTAINSVHSTVNVQTLKDTIALYGSPSTLYSLHAGDTFVFYIHAHGAFSLSPGPNEPRESLIRRQVPITNGTVTNMVPNDILTDGPTHLILGGIDSKSDETISASEFASLFSGGPIWNTVNKLFVIDSCYAKGMWEGAGGIGYLSKLPKSAIIWAAPEEEAAYGYLTSGGVLGTALAEVVSQDQSESFEFSDLRNRVISQEIAMRDNAYGAGAQIVVGGSGSAYGVPLGSVQPDPIGGFAADDFALNMSGVITTPEPTSTMLSSLGMFILFFCRTRHRSGAKE